MCTVCGCGEGETTIEGEGHHHDHHHGHGHGHLHFGEGPAHAHAPGLSQARMVRIEQDILAKNDEYAAANRRYFTGRGIHALNLVSSPGSGKTTLLVATIERLRGRLPVAVIEGDQQTSNDAERIRAAGAPAVQINTGKGCHLDAHMVGHALEQLEKLKLGSDEKSDPDFRNSSDPGKHNFSSDPNLISSVLFIENVGNLVCPASFDLGEAYKVVVLSVTEGADKPLKYPDIFHAARLMVVNKIDLLPYVDFDLDECIANARRINPEIGVVAVSARTGAGMEEWCERIVAGAGEDAAGRHHEVGRLRRRIAELEEELAALGQSGA